MIRCPNLKEPKAREAFNAVIERLGGLALSADDITPRQPYIARLTEPQERAYATAFYLWNAHKSPEAIGEFLDALDEVRNALEQPVDATKPPKNATEGGEYAKTPAPAQKAENESGRTPSVPPGEQKNAPAGNKLPAPAGKPFAGMIENQEAYRAAAKKRAERGGGTQQRPAFDAALMRAEIRPQDVPADLRELALARMLDRGEDAWTALDNVTAEAEHEAGWLESQAAIEEVEKNRTADEKLNALFQEVSPKTGAASAPDRGQAAEGAAPARAEAGANQPATREGAGEPAAEAKPAVVNEPIPAEIPDQLFHGAGRKSQTSPYRSAPVPIAGPAKYFAFSRKAAEAYGPNIEGASLRDIVSNPLIVTSGQEWRALTKEAGWEFPNPFGMTKAQLEPAAAKLQEIVKARGHDGIVIWWDDNSPYDTGPKGENLKLLRNVLGDPQVVAFPKTETAAATERTAAGQQHVLPGAERISSAEVAQRRAEQPLKPKVAQKPADQGLFSDERDQADLVDQARQAAARDEGAARTGLTTADLEHGLTEYRPVTEFTERGAGPQDMASGDEAMFAVRAGAMSVRSGRLEVVGPFTGEFAEHAKQIAPLLRAELDRLGLKDIALNLADNLELWWKGERAGTADGIYFEKAISIALDADQKFKFLHHEALHALRKLGLFKDTEWQILATQSDRTWRKQFDIDKTYDRHSEDSKTEEGIAHAYAAWANGEMKVDGRIARLFKRIRDFFEALRNALRGLGFKSAEDVFRDIKEGEIGGRSAAGREGESPMFAMREDTRPRTAAAMETPRMNQRIRDGIERVLESKAGRKFVEGVQDLSHPVKLLQRDLELRRGGTFEDPEDFYTRKRLYPGRIGNQTITFNRKHLDPIVNLLKSNEIGLQEAGDYLYALHAAERNEAMDKINPTVGGEGSGMSNDEAEKILAEAKRGEHAAAFDELRQKVGGIRDLILDIMEKGGLEKPAVIAEWRKRYKDYVPLRGWEVEPDDAPAEFRGPGAGFNVRGKEVKQALGRRSKADNPLVNLLDQAYRTFDRAERNRYLQSLYRAIDDLGEDASDIAMLDRGKPRREIDPRTGMVRSVETSNQYMNPKAVYLKFDGDPHFVVFRDQDLAEQVKRMSPASLGVLQPLLVLQNKMKALWTHYSPDFLFRHFMFRYPIEGTLNSFEQKESGEHSVAKYVKESFPFMGTASKAIFASNRGELADDPEIREMQKYWDEMRRAGGAMMFRNMRDIDLTREHLQTALKDLSDSPIQNAKAKWRHGVEAMDTVTNALDNSLRLAAYASARRQGKTVQQASFIAREATVDFQQKGLWANLMGILFPFSNVAVQTAARMTKALNRSKLMRRVFMGLMLEGFLTSMFNYLVAGDDKDNTPFFDKIPEWDRRLNFIILNPFTPDAKGRPQPIKIPLPYNWAFPHLLGSAFGSFMFGKEGPRKLAAMVLHSAMETFTPLGSEGNLAAEFTPSSLRPVTYIYTNLDWAGRPVHSNPEFQKRPNAYTSFRTTGEGWKDIAQGINTATGGSIGKEGIIDLYPEDYRAMVDQFVGTQLRLGQHIWDTAAAVSKGEWPEAKSVPLGRVVFGTDYDDADRARGYELRDRQKHPWKH